VDGFTGANAKIVDGGEQHCEGKRRGVLGTWNFELEGGELIWNVNMLIPGVGVAREKSELGTNDGVDCGD
jgi:hypothetical protein